MHVASASMLCYQTPSMDFLYLLQEDIPRCLPLRPETGGKLSGRGFSSSYLSLTPSTLAGLTSSLKMPQNFSPTLFWEALFSAGEDVACRHWGRNFVEKTEGWRQKTDAVFFRWFSREADGGYCLLTSSGSHYLRRFLHSLYISRWKYSRVSMKTCLSLVIRS